MKYAILFLLMIPNLALARKPAAAAKAAAPAPACARCTDIQKLETQFLALKYENAKDRAAGRELIVRVLAQLERFYTFRRAASAKVEFRALVSLVAAALPYDEGSESAESIANLITDSRDLKTVYNQTADTITDNCRQQLLRNLVEERACNIELETRGQSDQRPLSCVRSPVFRYDQCVGLKTDD
jgi:hypothetical protein